MKKIDMSGPFEWQGKRQHFGLWAKHPLCVVSKIILYQRLKSGWSMDRAMTTPLKTKNKEGEDIANWRNSYASYKGRLMSIYDWGHSEMCECGYTTFIKRIKKGMTVGAAFILDKKYRVWGEDKTLSEWSKDKRCVVARITLYKRVANGVPIKTAIISKTISRQSLYTITFATRLSYYGEWKTILEWSMDPRIKFSKDELIYRMKKGWTPPRILGLPE